MLRTSVQQGTTFVMRLEFRGEGRSDDFDAAVALLREHDPESIWVDEYRFDDRGSGASWVAVASPALFPVQEAHRATGAFDAFTFKVRARDTTHASVNKTFANLDLRARPGETPALELSDLSTTGQRATPRLDGILTLKLVLQKRK